MVLWRQLVAFSLRVQLRVPRTFINIQIHRFENNQLPRQKSKMADEDEPITFNSRSKSPYDKFSNFYEAEIKLPEGVFGSVEHYFQAMKFIDKNHSRFEINGDLGKRKIESGSWKESVSRGRFIKSAGGKSGTQKYKLTLRRNGLDRERAKQKMKEGLRKKFESKPFRSLLLETGARKLVHTPMRGKTDYWTGRVDKTSGKITGENNMGTLLMEVRQELQKAEKCSQKEEGIGAIEDTGESEFVDGNKDDDDIKDKNKGVDDEDEPLTFNSRSKSPYDKFSNFYEAEIKMAEGVFGSVEHYFQAMKFIDKNHSRFEINGDLGKRKIESGSWKESVSRGRFIKSAGGKSGTQKYKLTLRRNGLDRGRAKQKMKEGLRKKFESKPFRSLLLETGARKLVHTPMRGKTDYWTGRVDKTSGKITGENNMGKLLMEVRQELQKAEKCSQKEESIGAIEDKGESEFVDENKDDDDIKDENKGVDDIKDDHQKGADVIKGDDESTTSETKDSPGYKAAKRKHEGNDVQVKYPDEEEVSEGPKIKRKKIEVKSKDVSGNKSGDENKDGDKNKDDDKKGGVEHKGDGAETSRETTEGSGNKGEKRKHEGNDVPVECLDEEVAEGPKIKRKKTEEKSKDDIENKSDDENKSDGEETTHETKE